MKDNQHRMHGVTLDVVVRNKDLLSCTHVLSLVLYSCTMINLPAMTRLFFQLIFAVLVPKVVSSFKVEAHAFRLGPQSELKQGIIDYTTKNVLEAAYVSTCVGSVSKAKIRMASHVAGADAGSSIREFEGNREIVRYLIFNLRRSYWHLQLCFRIDALCP